MGPDEGRSLLGGGWREKSRKWAVQISPSGKEDRTSKTGLNADGAPEGFLFSLKMNKLAASFASVSMAMEEGKRKTVEEGFSG